MRRRIFRRCSTIIDQGASAVEYGLLVAAIAAVIVGTVFAFGNVLSDSFQQTSKCIALGAKSDPAPICDDGK